MADRTFAATPSPGEWRRFLSRALALLGAALLLGAAICFVAYNWDRLRHFGKFALIEIAIVSAALIAWRRLPTLMGQVPLLVAAVLVGPLLAVYGQTYQTGADPYGLFLTWLVLIVPWVIAGRLSALWIVALAVLDIGLSLFWAQVLWPQPDWLELGLPLAIAALHLTALAAWEWQNRLEVPWLRDRWAWYLVLVTGVAALTVAAVAFVVDARAAGVSGAIAVAALAVVIAGAFRYHRRVRADRLLLTVAVTAGMVWAGVLAGRVLFDLMELHELGLFLMAGFVIWEITLGVQWFRRAKAEDAPMSGSGQNSADGADLPAAASGDETAMPWYVRAVVSVGAWVATLLLFFFFAAVFDVRDYRLRLAIAGVVIAVAVWLRLRRPPEFLAHAAVALSFAGQGLVVAAIHNRTHDAGAAAFAGLVMSVTLIVIMPDSVHRFLSAIAGAACAMTAAAAFQSSVLVETVMLLLVAAVGAVWRVGLRRRSDRLARVLHPTGYGLVVALFGMLVYSTATTLSRESHHVLRSPAPASLATLTTIGITAALLALVWTVVDEHGATGSTLSFAALAGVAALGAGSLSAPGIIAGVAVLVLGFDRRDRVLMGTAVVFLLVFASAFYYSLDLTLLAKAGILAGSGMLLLAIRTRIAPWDAQTA